MLDHLRNHLALLRNNGVIVDWHDRRITAGTDWDKEIAKQLDEADIILLLVSSSFMGSAYIASKELSHAISRHQSGTAKVIPIILRPVAWQDSLLGDLQALPSFGKAVTEWGDRDRAFLDVARGLSGVVKEIQKTIQATATGEHATNADEIDVESAFYLNHTSFLRKAMQAEFQRRTRVPLDHYDIRVVIDSYNPLNLEKIEKVEYILDKSYPNSKVVLGSERWREKFLLKELANGEYLLCARVWLKGKEQPILLSRYITLWHSGPEL